MNTSIGVERLIKKVTPKANKRPVAKKHQSVVTRTAGRDGMNICEMHWYTKFNLPHDLKDVIIDSIPENCAPDPTQISNIRHKFVKNEISNCDYVLVAVVPQENETHICGVAMMDESDLSINITALCSSDGYGYFLIQNIANFAKRKKKEKMTISPVNGKVEEIYKKYGFHTTVMEKSV